MLKNLDPLLNADVLYALRAMGHGDTLVLSDTNFPSDSIARQTRLKRLLRIDATCARAASTSMRSSLPKVVWRATESAGKFASAITTVSPWPMARRA